MLTFFFFFLINWLVSSPIKIFRFFHIVYFLGEINLIISVSYLQITYLSSERERERERERGGGGRGERERERETHTHTNVLSY